MQEQTPAVGQRPFRLARGAQTTIVGNGDDRSVFQPASLSGTFEPHLHSLFERLIRPDWVCLDIGANIGLHALYMASLARRVVAFEAAPQTFGYLAANRERFADAGKLEIVHAALWDEATTLRIAVPLGLEGCAFIADAADDDTTSFAKVSAANPGTLEGRMQRLALSPVPAQRLDDWLQSHPLDRLDLVKLDVEGSEPRVLAGATAALARFDPILVTEYNPSCAQHCFGSKPDLYFTLLRRTFRFIHVVADDGVRLDPLSTWDELRTLLAGGKFWADLLCANRPLSELLAPDAAVTTSSPGHDWG